MSDTQMENPKNQLLAASDITDSKLEDLMGRMMSRQVDRGELYFQSFRNESWALEEGLVKDAGFSVSRGVGARAISGEKSGFAYADDIRPDVLEQTTSAAKSIAKQGSGTVAHVESDRALPMFYGTSDPITSVSQEDKVALLSRVDKFARNLDPRVKEVSVRIAATHESVYIYSSDGVSSGDVRPLVRFSVSVIAEQNGRREQGMSGGGGRHDLKWLFEGENAEDFAREAVRQALVNLDAVDAPAGPMQVVLGPGWPGVLLHEAVGHGLEGDFNRKGTSAFSNRIGQQVASPLCTIIDDATIPNRRGSLSMDDEGTPGQKTVLIENGVLKGYMHDKLNSALMGTTSTGNGRRESYAHQPMPRMTNTFMLAGESDPEEIIKSVDFGVYAVAFGGGQVDITSGQFVFSATEAYLIEQGKKSAPIRGATLIGNGPEIMTRVSMVGNDLELDRGVGVCGKEGQGVPVGVGQPTLKVDEITVGGTST
ncbi:MAG: metalloprotease TldD [Gammaproteobacteria bacterium]|nr:metalloprotease TldD [Gammaproteobacteria bacterium]